MSDASIRVGSAILDGREVVVTLAVGDGSRVYMTHEQALELALSIGRWAAMAKNTTEHVALGGPMTGLIVRPTEGCA